MNESQLFEVFEAALHALVTQRCQRAYAHDMRNGMQGIYGGFEVLGRAVKSEGAVKIPAERMIELSRQAIKNHEQALDSILGHLVFQQEAPAPTRIDEVLRETAKFLTNDAASKEVALRALQSDALQITLRPGRIRLCLLTLLLDAIDTLQAHDEVQLFVRNHEGETRVSIIELTSHEPASSRASLEACQMDLQAQPLLKGIGLSLAKKLLEAEGAVLSCGVTKEGEKYSRAIQLRFKSEA